MSVDYFRHTGNEWQCWHSNPRALPPEPMPSIPAFTFPPLSTLHPSFKALTTKVNNQRHCTFSCLSPALERFLRAEGLHSAWYTVQ